MISSAREMKTIGIVGGMSWVSTERYYRLLNEKIANRFPGLASAKILLHSLNFEEVEELQAAGQWKKAAMVIGNSAARLIEVGAECILVASNTGSQDGAYLRSRVVREGGWYIDIIDETGQELERKEYKKVALLGTRHTMMMPYWKEYIGNEFGIDTIIPDEDGIGKVDDIIYREVSRGVITKTSKFWLQKLVKALQAQGAEAVVLGCTELPIIFGRLSGVDFPVINSIEVHCEAAIRFALEEETE